MRFLLLTTVAPALTAALQSPYLSQLSLTNGAVRPAASSFAPVETPELVHALDQAVGSSASSPQELVNLWSNQVSVELQASQLYLSASIWFRARDLDGMAAWMLGESGEERGHGLAILEFAMKRHFPVTLKQLDAPRNDWTSPVQVWEDILHAEKTNTQNLLKLAAVADKCGDYSAVAFLNPFHTEQLHAEDKVGGILATLKAAPETLWELNVKLGIEAEEEEEHHH